MNTNVKIAIVNPKLFAVFLLLVASVAASVGQPANAGGCFRDSNGNLVCCDDNGYCSIRKE